MAALRIGVNALYLIPGGVGGTEIYLRNLLRALAKVDTENQYFVFANRETGPDLCPTAPNFTYEQQPVQAVNRPARLLYEQMRLPRRARELRLDCLFNPGFTAPGRQACPNVTVFHDLQHKRHPEYFRWFDLPAWNFFLWIAVRSSKLLIADSPASAEDLSRYYEVPPSRVRTVYLGVEEEFFEIAQQRTPEPFLLCASTSHPHKNLERLIQAFATFRKARPDFRLVITGVRGFRANAIEQQIRDSGCAPAIDLKGWIERSALYDLFRRASAFVYPSTFEGFGLPVVEAMAAGVPLACSNIEPLRSIAGRAALLFDPMDTDALADALMRVSTDVALREHLVLAGQKRAQEFTWESCASKTLDAIREASGADPRVGS